MKHIGFVVFNSHMSGGTNILLNHAMNLVINHGLSVSIIVDKGISPEEVNWHSISTLADHSRLHWLDFDQAASMNFDVVLTSFWKSVFTLGRIKAQQYVYFVQSIESRFFDISELANRLHIEKTYELPIHKVAIANWMSTYLEQVHRQPSSVVLNGIDKQRFTEQGAAISPRVKGRLRILVEGQLDSPMKNMKRTIDICRRSKADEIWLLTNTPCKRHPGIDRVFSGIPHHQTAEVYRSCDVLVKLSLVEGMFGPPLEMFHCGGTAIVYAVTGHEEYIKHEYNALVADMHNEAKVLEYINDLKHCPELLEKLKRNAVETANAWLTVDESSEQLYQVLNTLPASCCTQQTLSWRLASQLAWREREEESAHQAGHRLILRIYQNRWVSDFLNNRPRVRRVARKMYLALRAAVRKGRACKDKLRGVC